jgi:hypothetical protein
LSTCLTLLAAGELVTGLLANGALVPAAEGGYSLAAGAGGVLIGETFPVSIPAVLLGLAVGDTALCMLFVHLVFSQASDAGTGPVCDAILHPSSPQGPPFVPATPSPMPGPSPSSTSPPTSPTSLGTIPKVSATSGPAACALCYLVGYFQPVNTTSLVYCSPPQLDYYVEAKFLVRDFCDPTVANIEPFSSLCSAAFQNPCQQYSLNRVLETQGRALQPTFQNNFCGDLCSSGGDEGNCPIPDSEFSTTCTGGFCPGGESCAIDCGF